MPLSLAKLNDLLLSKGFSPKKYFTSDGSLFFVELFCVKNADSFLLYIPSKYTIDIRDKSENVYKLKNIDIDNPENIADEYGEQPDVEKLYDNNVAIIPQDKIEEHLQNNYKKEIKLSDVSKNDNEMIKSLFRQLKRLRYCVQNLPYKLGIFYKNYILPIRRDDSIDVYNIKKYNRDDNSKKIVVIVDLETLYEKDEYLVQDIKTVRESVYSILEKNQLGHIKMIDKIIENKKDIINIPNKAHIKKEQYDSMINKIENILSKIIIEENIVNNKLIKLNQSLGENINNDITRIQEKSILEKRKEEIENIKNDIVSTINTLRKKKENTILAIDKIMFDNTVMFDTMTKNFSLLKEYC